VGPELARCVHIASPTTLVHRFRAQVPSAPSRSSKTPKWGWGGGARRGASQARHSQQSHRGLVRRVQESSMIAPRTCTSARSIDFCAIWICFSSSSSSLEHRNLSTHRKSACTAKAAENVFKVSLEIPPCIRSSIFLFIFARPSSREL
jgi:hypothetical protein